MEAAALALVLMVRVLPLAQPTPGGHLQHGATEVRAVLSGPGSVRDALAVGGPPS